MGDGVADVLVQLKREVQFKEVLPTAFFFFFKQPFSVMDMGKLRGKLKTLIDTVILKSESKELQLSFGLYAASVWFSSGAHQTT